MKKYAFLLPMLLMGCVEKDFDDSILNLSVNDLKSRAETSYYSGYKRGALDYYEAITLNYPDSKEAKKAYLKAFDIYQSLNDKDGYMVLSEQYLSIYPNEKETASVLWTRAMMQKKSYSGKITKFLLKHPDRDIEYLLKANKDFEAILALPGQSKYKKLAKEQMQEITNTLARHELKVADYYYGKGNLSAAQFRAQRALKSYPGASKEILNKAKKMINHQV